MITTVIEEDFVQSKRFLTIIIIIFLLLLFLSLNFLN